MMLEGENMNLLIVDDDVLNLKVAGDLIIKNEVPVRIKKARCGVEALDIIERDGIDIMLLDIVMPDFNGVEVLKRIKLYSKHRDIKILMFSSLDDQETLKECFEYGASDYITKPIQEIEFIARLKSAILEKELDKSNHKITQKLITQNSELLSLNNQLKEAQSQLIQQEKLAAVGHLAAGVAHEINNPLGFIISNYSTLKKYVGKYKELLKQVTDSKNSGIEPLYEFASKTDFEFIEEDMSELFKDTLTGLERVKIIVEELRKFSRLDTLEEMESYSLNDGVKNTLILSENEFREVAEIETIYGDIPNINAVGGQIDQVILSLVMNALFAIKGKGEDRLGLISITTYCDSHYVYLKIKDSGVGIAQEEIKSIFNPFFTTKPVGEGTGLGLSTAYDTIVNKHDGILDVSSEKGIGTEFTLGLPLGTLD